MAATPVSFAPSRRRRAAALALVGLVAAGLSGCGRRGDLEPAPDPSVNAATSAGETVNPVVRRARREPITPSKESFLLDPLL